MMRRLSVVAACLSLSCGGSDGDKQEKAAGAEGSDTTGSSGGSTSSSGGSASDSGGTGDNSATSSSGGSASTNVTSTTTGGAGSSVGGTGGTSGAGGSTSTTTTIGVGGQSTSGTVGSTTDGGGGSVSSYLPPASLSGDGVLTNRPELTFSTTGSLVITTAYVSLLELSSFNSILMWGDIENQGTDTQCLLLADVTINGIDILTVIDAPAYEDVLTLTSPCIPPGGTGVFSGIENDVPSTLLDGSPILQYSVSGLASPGLSPHPLEPTVEASIQPVVGGYGVAGTIHTQSMPIYNFGISVYARDANGLLFSDNPAYPGDLDTLPLSTSLEFETSAATIDLGDPVPGPFADFELYTSFIEGSASQRVIGAPVSEQVDAHEARRKAVQEAKRRLAAAASD